MNSYIPRAHRSLRAQLKSLMRAERVLLVCMTLGALVVIFQSARLILSPYQIDYGEGLMLDGALRLRDSQPLYPNPYSFPVVLHVYGPVAYAATAAVLPGGAPSFPAGRLLILTCSIALSLLISVILHHLTRSWWIGVSFGLLLLTLPAFRFWIYLLRADVIGTVFSTIGVAIYLISAKRWPWSMPFFVLALFCKYTLIAAPIAIFLHLISKRMGKRGAAFAVAFAVLSGVVFVVFAIKSAGWFAFHMFSTHPDRYSFVQFIALAVIVSASAPVVTALASWYAAGFSREDTRIRSPLSGSKQHHCFNCWQARINN